MAQDREGVSVRQFRQLLYLVMLPVVVRTMPGRLAETAGAAGWLAPLAALLPTLPVAWLAVRLITPTPGRWRGMAEVFCHALGPVAGRVLSLIYLVWLLVLTCDVLRLYGERFLSSIYEHMSPAPFFVVLLLLVFWMLRGSFAALARVNQIFFPALAVVLLAVLLLSLHSVEPIQVLPIRGQDALPVGRAVLPMMNVMALAFYTTFLAGGIRQRETSRPGRFLWGLGGFCLFAALFQFVVTGNFGAALAARIRLPLFALSKQIRILGAFERMESVTISLWVFTDLILVCTMLLACCTILQQTGLFRDGRSAAGPLVLLCLAGAYLIAGDAFALETFSRRLVQPLNAALGYGVPFVLYFVEMARTRRQKPERNWHSRKK